jgi:hypothetical protein
MWCILDKFVDQRQWYRVMCQCGYIGKRRVDHVNVGRTVCCKRCASKKTAAKHGVPINYKGVGDLSATFWLHIKHGAKRRSIEFAITIEYAWQLFVQQQAKCALSGETITMCRSSRGCNVNWKRTTASLDRKDSNCGYVEGNVQWVHKTINYIKRDLSDREFIQWCNKVHANHEPSSGNSEIVPETVQRLEGEELIQ